MDNADLNESVIREYLLGRQDGNQDLWERIDEQTLTDPEFSETVAVVEDEIIEEYLEGALSADDREACERHFLRPPERQQKLRQARLLNSHLAVASPSPADVKDAESSRLSLARAARILPFPRLRIYAEIAAAILFAISLGYIARLRNELKNELSQDSLQLAQVQQHAAVLNHQLVADVQQGLAPTTQLSLLEPGTLRGDAHLPELRIGPGAGTIHTEVALPRGASGAYAVQVLCTGVAVWSHGPIDSRAIQGGAILTVEFPAQVLSAGNCKLALRHVSDSDISYLFSVSKLQ
jgi:hypothetical protein